MIGTMKPASSLGTATSALLFYLFSFPPAVQDKFSHCRAGVTSLFDPIDGRGISSRVQDNALPCLKQAARKLRENPGVKLVLVGEADPLKDHEAEENGQMRETEDATGLDVRWEDLAAYRSLNTKWYLTRWFGIKPSRVLPTTNESIQSQEVTFYLVPAAADFNHNYLGTTKTNERPCTVKPCYSADEESLKAQPRSRIPQPAGTSNGK